MKPIWFDKITIETLPNKPNFPLQDVALEIADVVRPLLRKDQQDLAEKIALEAIKVELVAFEGTEPYWPQFEGDKFIDVRYAAIRKDFRRMKASGAFNLRAFLDRWNMSERQMRSILNGDHEKQLEAFPDED